jgi:uncharacterized membrane protein
MFLGLTLLSLIIPALLGGLLAPILAAPFFASGSTGERVVPMLVTFLLIVMFMMLFQGAITYAVFQIFMEGRASVSASLGRAISRVVDLLLMAFCALLITGGIMILLSLIAGVLAAVLGRTGPGGLYIIVMVIVVVAAVAVPSILFCRWYAAAPACVVEGTGPVRSLGRSGELTKGRRMKIYGLLSLVLIIVGIISGVVNFIVTRTIGYEGVGSIISAIVNVVPLAFVNVMSTVVYYSLRVEKENLTAATLADIFD